MSQPDDPAASDPEGSISDAPEPSAPDPLSELAAAKDHAIAIGQPIRRSDIESRFVATLLDMLIWLMIAVLCIFGFWIIEKLTFPRLSISEPLRWLVTTTAWLLYTLFEVFGVGTPGKRLIGIRIGAMDGQAATIERKCFRWLIRRLPDLAAAFSASLVYWGQNHWLPRVLDFVFILLLPAIGFVVYLEFMAFICCMGHQKLALYDRWTGTAVMDDLDKTDPPKAGFRVVMPTSFNENNQTE